MDLYNTVCANIAKRHLESNGPTISLEKNVVNNGGHNTFDSLEGSIYYKVMLPTPLRHREAFVLVVCDKDTHKPFPQSMYTVYENDVEIFFIKFFQPMNGCYFLVNQT